MEKHSEKGLNTITQMGTVPSDWAFVEMKWVMELRKVPTKCKCPECFGTAYHWVRGTEEMSYAENQKQAKAAGVYMASFYQVDHFALDKGFKKAYGCRHCRMSGKVWMAVERMVEVGYPQWHSETLFDSRFRYAGCELCGKQVLKSNLYPVTAKGSDGRIHGMWVGMDCAKKFMGLKNFKKDEENQFFANGLEA